MNLKEHMCTCGRFILIFGKSNTVMLSLKIKLKKKLRLEREYKQVNISWDTNIILEILNSGEFG